MSQNPIHIPSDSILNGDQSSLKPKEIFQSVCDLIGNYYQEQGWIYTKSKPRMRLSSDEFELEINFWSSRYNTAGEWVNLEILGSVHSNNLAQLDKQSKNKRRGCFVTTQNFMRKINNSNPKGEINYYNSEGEIASHRQTDFAFAMDVFTNHFNIYDIDNSRLNDIIRYIDSKFIAQMNTLFNRNGLIEFFQTVIPQSLHQEDPERLLKVVEFHYQNDDQLVKLIKQKFM